MMSNVRRLCSFVLLALVVSVNVAAPALAEDCIPWVADFQTACGMAAEQHRLVLIHFYSDNCPWCVRLDQNVFTKTQVAEAVAMNYVAVKVHAGKQPQLANRYQVKAFPSDVFVNPSGLEVFRTVSRQKPEEYIAVLHQVADQSGVGAARQWKSLMGQTLKPAADPTANANNLVNNFIANNVPVKTDTVKNVTQTFQQAGDKAEAAGSQWKQQAGALTTQLQSAGENATSKFEQTAANASTAIQQSGQQVTATAKQFEQAATDKARQAIDATNQWTQQASDKLQSYEKTVQDYEKQAGDAYRQFRDQTTAKAQQVENRIENARQQVESTTQQAAQDVSETAGNLKNQLQQASQSLLERRSAFVPAVPSPASPAPASEAPKPSPPATPSAPEASPTTAPASFVTPSPPALTMNPWVAAGAGAANKAASSPSAPNKTPLSTIPVSQAPPIALDGFCPVTLAEAMASNPTNHAAWKKGDKRFGAIHHGRTFLFTSAEQQQKFLNNPDAYAPLLSGCDPVLYAERGQLIDGKRAYGIITPEKQMILFADEATLNRFKQTPANYTGAIQQAMTQTSGGTIYR